MTLENEQEYRNTLQAYRKIQQDVQDALIDGITQTTHPGFETTRDIMREYERQLIEYEERQGKALITRRSPWVQNDDDLQRFSDLYQRTQDKCRANGTELDAATAQLGVDIESYRQRRRKRDVAPH